MDKLPEVSNPTQIEHFAANADLNAVHLQSIISDFQLTPYGTAQFSRRWRRWDGLSPNSGLITLGVHFLDGRETDKQTVRKAASSWLSGEQGNRLAFRFDVPRNQAQITITFQTSVNSSVVGRDSVKYAARYATMHLADVTDHIIQHEFGHAIGLQHEHQHPGGAIHWNRPAVIADMKRQGWSPSDVQKNIFERYSTTYACIGDRSFNPASIMLYPIPVHWTVNGFSSSENTEISARDRRCLEAIYRA